MYKTINEAYEYLVNTYNETCITPYLLRTLCKSGVIKTINAGGKYLINMKSLLDYLELDYREI